MLLPTSTYSKILMGRAGVVRQGVLFNSVSFERLASEIAQEDLRVDLAFTCEASAALQCSAEAYMVRCEHQQCAIAIQATHYLSFAWVAGRALPRCPPHGDPCSPTDNSAKGPPACPARPW